MPDRTQENCLKGRILVVEDEGIVALSVADHLRSLGYEVAGTAHTGEEAIATATATRPDLVLMDINLGSGIDGIEAATRINEELSIPSLFLTAYADRDTLRRVKGTGPVGYILKPFDERNLEVSVEMAIYRAKLERDLREALAEQQRVADELRRNEELIRQLNERLEDRVRERTLELENSNRELEAFCYSVSHDLRAPLRHINSYSAIILEDYTEQLDDEGRGYLGRLCAASRQMGLLIDDLLNLSRVSRTQMRYEPVTLSDLARTIARELEESVPKRQLRFQIDDGLTASGDPQLLRLVIQNLLENAWKYTAPMTEAIIEFGRTEVRGQPVFFVRDNGVGFDMAHAAKLFGVFERLHSTSEFEGSGIGLATVQRIVQRHGGMVWGESQVGHGATFYFTLPPAAPPAPAR